MKPIIYGLFPARLQLLKNILNWIVVALNLIFIRLLLLTVLITCAMLIFKLIVSTRETTDVLNIGFNYAEMRSKRAAIV